MKKNKDNNITGYIEGYYGRILSWENRELIIKSLHKNKMNTYFYAPKEDVNHRLHWRKKYSQKWRLNFRKFTMFCRKNGVTVIAGIAPGLDFDFKDINDISKTNKHSDFKLLLNKAKQLLNDGADSIALMLDDIPNDFKRKFGKEISEGTYHATLANKLLEKLNKNIFFVPRIYADELIKEDPLYLSYISKVINPKIKVFYCGKNIVSKKLTGYNKIKKVLDNDIIYWDNYYANDYCPRRFFIGPLIGRQKIKNIMINPTGLIKTDLLILDIFSCIFNEKFSSSDWKKLLANHGVPKNFIKLKDFFYKPGFGLNTKISKINVKDKDFEELDFLLWKWKGKLSREWYPFILGLKQDLQINKNHLSSERIIKTQTIPLSEFLNKGEF